MNEKNLRKFILITLTHADRRDVTQNEVLERIKAAFKCFSIVIATEKHESEGFHYHVALKNGSASRNNATKIIRKLFPEFEGKQCDVKFQKGWAPICTYITKEDKEPIVWGEYSRQQILKIAENQTRHKKNNVIPAAIIIENLKNCNEWLDVYDQQILRERLLTSYNNMKKIHEDLETIKQIRKTLGEKIVKYLQEKQWPEEYKPEEIKEKYVLLDWVACQLIFQRPIKTKQLFLYGEPSTQKTLIMSYLARVLRIYFASSRRNDFAGADNYYDLWVFDEFHEPEEEQGIYITSATEAGTAYANTLLKVLDGQECRLDAKYGKIFTKKVNVPIIMIANQLPKTVKTKGPLQERFMRILFSNQIEEISEKRTIATLWGCIKRRVSRNITLQKQEQIKTHVNIKYNNEKIDINIKEGTGVTQKNEVLKIEVGKTGIEEEIEGKISFEPYAYLKASIKEKQLNGENLSLINYALIPIEKEKEKNEDKKEKLKVFKSQRKGENFTIHRYKEKHLLDYIAWPIRMQMKESKEGGIGVELTINGITKNNEKNKETKKRVGGGTQWELTLGPVGNGMEKELWNEND